MPAPLAPPRYPELAAEIARTGTCQNDLAAAIGCASGTLSQVIRGRLRPSEDLQRRIADALGRPVGELFAVTTGGDSNVSAA